MSSKTDVIGWEIERRGRTAVVREDGEVSCPDQELRDYLRSRLSEPVDVLSAGGNGARPLRIAPGDRRYVVARVRSLPREDPDLRIVGIVWDG